MWSRKNRGPSRPRKRLAAMSRLSHSSVCWRTKAIPRREAARGRAGTGRPSRKISPLLGVMSPATHPANVVLPAPFSPAMATSWPDGTSRSTPFSASSRPKRTVRSRTRSRAGAPPGALAPRGGPGGLTAVALVARSEPQPPPWSEVCAGREPASSHAAPPPNAPHAVGLGRPNEERP